MIYELRMPDLTTNDAPVRIVRWIARPGETIDARSALAGSGDRQGDDGSRVGDQRQIGSGALPGRRGSVGRPGDRGLRCRGLNADRVDRDCRSHSVRSHSRWLLPPVAVPSAAKPVGMFARNRAAATCRESAGRQSSADASRSGRQPGGCSRASRRSRTSTCRRLSTLRRLSHAARLPNRSSWPGTPFLSGPWPWRSAASIAFAAGSTANGWCRPTAMRLAWPSIADNELFVIPVHGSGGQDRRAGLGRNSPCGRSVCGTAIRRCVASTRR